MIASSGVVISNLAYLIGAVILAVIGGLIVWLRHRQPKSVDANVASFHRGLRALAPDSPGSGPLRGPPAAGSSGSSGPRVKPRPHPAVSVVEVADHVEVADRAEGDGGSGAETG